MNIYQQLNQMLNYIEEHLEEKIQYKTLSAMLGTNEYTMQSIFSFLANCNLSEYIRKRRLSSAGVDLYHTDEKVMDIAMKYQYDNATSFSRAFEKFHGMKPSEVRKKPDKLKVYAKIVFDETKQIQNKDILYSIIEKEELVLYGKGEKTTEEEIGKLAPRFYVETNHQFYEEYGTDAPYGMTIYEARFESNKLEYWVLWDKKMKGLKEYKIPKSKWLAFKVPTQKAKDIQETTKIVYEQFIPSCNYNLKPIPELEYYHDGVTDFLIPIEE